MNAYDPPQFSRIAFDAPFLETGQVMQTTFPRLMLKHAAERPTAPALREKEYGIWQATSWAALSQLVESIACGLHQAGLQRGEHLIVVG